MTFPILSTLMFLPLTAAVFLMLVGDNHKNHAGFARAFALFISLLNFIISVVLWMQFDNEASGFQFVENYRWFSNLPINYLVGVDGFSLFFIILSTLLTPICIWSASESIKYRVRDYMVAFLILETMMIGSFTALNLFLFYIFFEGVLLPMFLIIGEWGGKNRIYASFKFFLYTLLGSVIMLVAILILTSLAGTGDITELKNIKIPLILQFIMFIAFFASFSVKMPMLPVHTWLPDAHVEAPTAGSVILAGVLLKMGGYGFLRFSLNLFPDASFHLSGFMQILSVIAIIYTSLVALVQTDMKKLIAYSSVAHMGFVTAGLFSFNKEAIAGAIMVMLSHGLVSGALFLVVGVVYDRMHTRDIAAYGGLVHKMPRYALIFMFFTMASVALPGTSSFVGEFLVLTGLFQYSTLFALLAGLGMVLGAAYPLYLYRRVIFGSLEKNELKNILDLNRRELSIFMILVVLTLWMGIYPQTFIQVLHEPLDNLMAQFPTAQPTGE